jgi:hypothetical protein
MKKAAENNDFESRYFIGQPLTKVCLSMFGTVLFKLFNGQFNHLVRKPNDYGPA